MNDTTEKTSVIMPGSSAAKESWRGCTLEQLRRRRAVALVRCELDRERLGGSINQLRGDVANNGMRGLLFSNNTVSRLKAVDYLLLGWRVASWCISRRKRRRR